MRTKFIWCIYKLSYSWTLLAIDDRKIIQSTINSFLKYMHTNRQTDRQTDSEKSDLWCMKYIYEIKRICCGRSSECVLQFSLSVYACSKLFKFTNIDSTYSNNNNNKQYMYSNFSIFIYIYIKLKWQFMLSKCNGTAASSHDHTLSQAAVSLFEQMFAY